MRFIRRFYNYYLHPDKELARRLKTLIGFTPTHLSLFKLAFFHKSTFNTRDYAIANNERLEFLGDAVLSTIVGEYLFKKYPNSDEGFLTKMRSKIVKRNSLDEIADKMGLDLFLANYNQTRLSKSMLGNALEALVGAVYIEVGYERTKQYVIRRILRRYLDIHELESFDDNYKSQLLEWCQKNGRNIEYKVVAKYKSEKRDKFKVAVYVDGKKLGTADDFNKKSAEQLASERAMAAMGILNGNGTPASPQHEQAPDDEEMGDE
ncbi:MAG: ribonuclease III [Saprospiraceae bacterium]|nr:ribonuclease III [Saprospiraceae bacterium]